MKLSLNKQTLKQQRDQLSMYHRFLPSLDLKRQQLLTAYKESQQEYRLVEEEKTKHDKQLTSLFPLLGGSTLKSVDLDELVRIKDAEIFEQNIVGTRVPILKKLTFDVADYSRLILPFWVDVLAEELQEAARLKLELQLAKRKMELLEEASRRITQRVNLFEKVLIPTAKKNIKRIVLALSDEERAAVVRSKLAKQIQHRDEGES